MKNKLKRLIKKVLHFSFRRSFRFYMQIILLLVISVAFLSYYLGSLSWILENLSNFQLQFQIILIILSIFLLVRKFFKEAIISIFSILYIGLFFITPISVSASPMESPDIFFMNTQYDNYNSEDIVATIIESNPQTVGLTESNDQLVENLSKIYSQPIIDLQSLPKGEPDPRRCLILSREENYSVLDTSNSSQPICAVEFENYIFIVFHPSPASSKEMHKAMKANFNEVNELIKYSESKNKSFVLAGDFNSSSYSPTFRNNFNSYFQQNIYTFMIGSPISIPIDHIISDQEIEVSRTKKLSSDHAGLYMRFIKESNHP